MLRTVRLVLSLAFAALVGQSALAQSPGTAENIDDFGKAYRQATFGPAIVRLRDFAAVDVPKGFAFIPAPAANVFLHARRFAFDSPIWGVVVPAKQYEGWYISLASSETGYVAQADLSALGHEDVRSSLAATLRRGNSARMQRGTTMLDVGAFLEPPRHEPQLHRYTTALRIFETGPSSGDDDLFNVTTHLFGRYHALDVTLVGALSDYDRYRPLQKNLVDGTKFIEGHRAGDFVAGKDPRANHVLDLVFGGRSSAELAAEAAEEAAEMQRRANLPPQRSLASQMQFALFGVLALAAAFGGALAFFRRGNGDQPPQHNHLVERALRSPKRS